MKLKDMKPAPYNPRKMTKEEFEKLKRSIKEFGYVEPIIINKRTGNIVGGNQRYRALMELYGENYNAKVVEIDIPEDKEKTLNIALNRISGTWDEAALAQILTELDDDLRNLTGFDEYEISKFLNNEIIEEMSLSDIALPKSEDKIVIVFSDRSDYDKAKDYMNLALKKYNLDSFADLLVMIADKNMLRV